VAVLRVSAPPWRTARAAALLLLLPLLALARGAGAQAAPRDPARTTRSGVYTAAQADRGADVYAGMCRSCHAPASHTGVVFSKAWKGRPLADLFTYVSERMPKNEPGSLAPEQYADVVAYMLKLNAMPPGPAELAPDSAALATIRIDVDEAGAGTPVRKDPHRRR
jgi:S-disulfanyl-L-cysteine oxidoreductase SoxD